MTLTPRWICPRCHIRLKEPFGLCAPCDRSGNATARLEDGSIRKLAYGKEGWTL